MRQGGLSVVNTLTNTVTTTVQVGARPFGAAINSAGTRVYVCNNGSNDVSVIDTSTNTVIATIPVSNSPSSIAVNPSGTFVYVSTLEGVSIIQAATNTLVANVPTSRGNQGLAADPTGKYVYVTHVGSSNLDPAYVIDANTNALLPPINPGNGIGGLDAIDLTFSADGANAYLMDYDNGAVSVVSTATRKITSSIQVSGSLGAITRNTSDGKIYVASATSSVISIIDPTTKTLVDSFGGFACFYQLAMAFNPSGTRVYVLCDVGTLGAASVALQVLDVQTRKVVTTISGLGNDYVHQIAIGGPLAPSTIPPTISFVGSSATGTSPFSAGQLISIYGSQLGPTPPSGAQIGPGGGVTNSSGGVQVLFDGVAAPILYAGATQINTVIPCSVAGHPTTQMIAMYGGAHSTPINLTLSSAAPGIFTVNGSGQGQGVILNQDGSLNSVSNPAPRGSEVAFYATGIGLTSPCIDGQVYGSNFPIPTLPVMVGIGNIGAQVLYAGQAPFLVSGAAQVNIVIPNDAPSGPVPLTLEVGGVSSPIGVSIAAK
jgi:uncharacterized protein (TIGR03437 family)